MLSGIWVVAIRLDNEVDEAFLIDWRNWRIVAANPLVVDPQVEVEVASWPQTAVPLRVRKLQFISVRVVRQLLLAAHFQHEHAVFISWDLGH